MSKLLEIARIVFAALLALAPVSMARGDAPTRTRVTIRGSGNNVTIEESQAPARRRSVEKSPFPAGAIGEALRLKTEGESDARVIAYLRAHELELPPVIEAAEMRQLRKAGAGKSVAAYLAAVAAVEIGETGQGHEPAASNAVYPEGEGETLVYGMSSGYPAGGGYAAPYPARRGARGFSQRRMPFPRGLPLLRGSFPRHRMPARRRME